MISPHRPSDEDASTVQVTDANSLLGTHLLEGEWDEALQHLKTPEGIYDATSNNNPLGLFQSGGSKAYQDIPNNKTTALFAALFVRAPFDIVVKICEISPNQYEPDDLAYALSIIPSEEEERLMSHPRQRIPYRSRAWSIEEYNQIICLLLQHSRDDNRGYSSMSPFLDKCPSWILPFPLTPLGIAAYNPDVSDKTLRFICMLEPKSINIECRLFGVDTLPFLIAAASPVPPKPRIGESVSVETKYDKAKERRWEKVKSLIVGIEVYSDEQVCVNEPFQREPSVDKIVAACEEAMKRHEWELVREFLKRYDESRLPVVQAHLESPTGGRYCAYTDQKALPEAEVKIPIHEIQSTSSPLLESIRTALSEHDRKRKHHLENQRKTRSRDDWAHKNMGLVMYPIDAMVDVATAIVPSAFLKRRHSGNKDGINAIVSPMS